MVSDHLLLHQLHPSEPVNQHIQLQKHLGLPVGSQFARLLIQNFKVSNIQRSHTLREQREKD